MVTLQQTAAGVVISVKVRAGARRTGVAGEHNGALRIDVAAAPEKGRANRAVVAVLAELFHMAKSSVELTSGATSSQKRFLLAGVELADAQRLLAAAAKS